MVQRLGAARQVDGRMGKEEEGKTNHPSHCKRCSRGTERRIWRLCLRRRTFLMYVVVSWREMCAQRMQFTLQSLLHSTLAAPLYAPLYPYALYNARDDGRRETDSDAIICCIPSALQYTPSLSNSRIAWRVAGCDCGGFVAQ